MFYIFGDTIRLSCCIFSVSPSFNPTKQWVFPYVKNKKCTELSGTFNTFQNWSYKFIFIFIREYVVEQLISYKYLV